MAISTSTYVSNSIVGVPQVGGEANVFDSHAIPKFAIGTKFERSDGAVFRYAMFAVSSTAGQLVAPTNSEVAKAFAVGNTCLAPTATAQMPDETPGVYPGSLGSRYLIASVGLTTTANQYAGGYLNITNGTGKGFTYRVKNNTAGTTAYNSSGSTGYVRFTLADKLVVAVDTTSGITISPSKYNDLTTAVSSNPNASGVSVTNQTTNYYGWIQTQGIVGVNSDGVIGIGNVVTVSTGSAVGAVMAATVANGGTANLFAFPIIGSAATVGSAGAGMTIINLELEQ